MESSVFIEFQFKKKSYPRQMSVKNLKNANCRIKKKRGRNTEKEKEKKNCRSVKNETERGR